MDTGLVAVAALGFFLGMRHATDADHVIAVTTIVARQRSTRSAGLIGAVWGLGHTLTILVVGGGIILFGWVIPPRVGLSMEFSVGLMLIILGLMNLTGVLQWMSDRAVSDASAGATHSHPHSHGDYVHSHHHGHDPERHPHRADRTPVAWLDGHLGHSGIYQVIRPLVVGIVHGLAGSAAVALLVLTTIRNPQWSMVYLLIFGLGTLAGMMLLTQLIAVPFAITSQRSGRFHGHLRIASGLLSLAFGGFVAYQTGVASGLLSGNPQ